jgi:hypothetical protein
MEKIISNDLAKLAIIMVAGVLGLTALLAKQIASARGAFKPYRKKTLIYLIFALLFFSVIALAAHPLLIDNPFTSLICFQAYFLLLGIAHLHYMRANLAWSGDEKAFVPEMIFTIVVALFGAIGFILLYSFFSNKDELRYVMAGSVLLFIIPFFFVRTFKKAIEIPPKILKEWFYPIKEEIEEPDDSKLKNLLIISFEFQKRLQENKLTNFRAKAPSDMEFGQLFYYFINDYNDRHPDSKVEYSNGNGKPHGWIFYKKPQWYSITTQYIDVDKSIFNNNIKENDVIICTRSLS